MVMAVKARLLRQKITEALRQIGQLTPEQRDIIRMYRVLCCPGSRQKNKEKAIVP
jgi:DNA-directed RNA polymerase sigma subunit (sigma70/sigma32)